jgi:PAS domain S-box-containing protein
VAPSSNGGAGRRLSVRAFGPLHIACEDDTRGPADFGGARPRQVFEILLSSRGHPVPKDRLVELLWEQDPPQNATAALESHVSVLRRHLSLCGRRGRDVVITVPGQGYAIELEAIELDLDAFDDLVSAAANAAQADMLGLLEEALAIARGPVLEHEQGAAWAKRMRVRYDETVDRVRLDAAEAALAERSFVTALDHATNVARTDPSNERACRIVMMAAYAAGDQERAVGAYIETRAALSHRLGLEPLPETQALYLAILRHESPTSLLPDDVRRTEPGFRRLVDQQGAEGWWTIDPELHVTSVVGEPGRFIGLEGAQIAGRTAHEVGAGVDLPAIVSDHRRALNGEPVTRAIAVGGRTYEVHLEPMRHGSDVVGVVGVSMDVTERERTAAAVQEMEQALPPEDQYPHDLENRQELEDELAQIRRELCEVLDRASDALFVLDPWADLIIATNDAAAEMLGYERDELLRHRPSDIHRGEMGAFLGFMDRVDAHGSDWTDHLSCTTRDGQLLRVAMAATRISFHRRRAVLSVIRAIERGRETDPRLLARLGAGREG